MPLAPDEIGLLKAELVRLKARLQQQVAGLREGLRQPQAEALGELSVRDNHPADLGSELFERSKDLALEGMLRRRLEQVDRALWRIDHGLYGICARCGHPIAPERLRAVPEAELCLECQQREEREEWPQPEARPVEEEVLQGPVARLHGFGQGRRVGYDEEDAWQEVERYGTSDTPQDIPGTRSYDELVRHGDERVGVVQAVEGLVDQSGEVIADAPAELELEALADAHGDMAVREGESVRVTRRRRLSPGPR